MRILVITRSSWKNDNNIGNTMTNIFKNFENDEIYSLCFRSELPQNDVAKADFCISEQQIIRYFTRKGKIGKIRTASEFGESKKELEDKLYTGAKKNHSRLLWFAREILWSISPWKNKMLDEYIDEVSPDIIFMPVFGCWYTHKVLRYIMKRTTAKLVLFHADDNYSLRQFSLSPVYWLYRFNLRKWVRNSVKLSSINYVISEVQKNEYAKTFGKEFKILYKGYEFVDMPVGEETHTPIKLVFTGNISSGRYKQLASIGRAIADINKGEKKLELDIYTLTPMTKKMKNMLDIEGAVNLKGGVSADAIDSIQKDADILIHVESFDLRNRFAVHQSFSTKIVDYLHQAKCIFAVGPKDVASIDYLLKNDAAIVATTYDEIEKKLIELCTDINLINEYEKKSWECGKHNHRIDEIQKNLDGDFKNLIVN